MQQPGNNFRVGKGPFNLKRVFSGNKMNNIFDGNELAGSSTFKGLDNTASRLGNSGRFDNFNLGKLKKVTKKGRNLRSMPNGINPGYATAPEFQNNFGNYAGYNLQPPGGEFEFQGYDGYNQENFNHPYDQDDTDEEPEELEFKYHHDFDENGALFWLGSYGKTSSYNNPYTLN